MVFPLQLDLTTITIRTDDNNNNYLVDASSDKNDDHTTEILRGIESPKMVLLLCFQ